MIRLAARARPIAALQKTRLLYHLPTFATDNTFLSSCRHASSRPPKFDPHFFDETLVRTNESGPSRHFGKGKSDRTDRGLYMEVPDTTEGEFKYMHYMQFSEVATMNFVREILKLPVVPRAWLWSNPDASSAFLKTAVAMKNAEGTPVSACISDIQKSAANTVRAAHSSWLIEKKVSSITFDRYGSLYQPSSDFMYEIPGSHKAKVLDGASPEEKQLIESQFYIGPSCEPRLFQRDGRHLMEEYHGPWTSAVDYVESLLRCEIEVLSKKINESEVPGGPLDKDGISYEMHVELLQKALSVVPHIMPKDSESTSPRLYHPTLGPDDVFYDEEYRVKTIIGWSGASIAPFFESLHWALQLSPQSDPIEPEGLIRRLQSEVGGDEFDELCQTLWERSAMLKKAQKNPILPLIHVAMETRRYGTIPLQTLLMHIHSHWIDFDAGEPCPFQIPPEAKREADKLMDRLVAEGKDKELIRAIPQVGMWTLGR
ncbi:hypothetical protein IWZ00DRAFT_63896 [Phyllosticta capitalensis]|uniref:uncharacterized protein n=1 Tax=Phyllosticta capitalensis TaxID=121624 RepID=UPI00313264BB